MKLFDKIVPQDDGQFKIGHVLTAYRKKKGIRFIEVGANDGITNDPIYDWAQKGEWEGILIEPGCEAFDLLKENYNDFPNVILLNVAISSYCGVIPLFVNKRTTGAASVHRKHPPNWKAKKREVECLTLNQVIEDHDFAEFDLLQIDAEGHDFEVLKSISLDIYHPVIIHYEHRHLSKKDLKNCDSYLENLGYTILKNRNNTLGVLEVGE